MPRQGVAWSFEIGVVSAALLAACSAFDASLIEGRTQRGSAVMDDTLPDMRPIDAGPGGGGTLDDVVVDVEPCGDGLVTEGEHCDVAIPQGALGACPTECPAADPCLPKELQGADCQAKCEVVQLECVDGDACCPPGCSNESDGDCSGACGDGVIQDDLGETCEAPGLDDEGEVAECPTECPDDGDACTLETLVGSADNCNAACTISVIEVLDGSDGCCPDGADSTLDADCPVVCGNDVVEQGEDCDGGSNCDEQCGFLVPPDQLQCREAFTDVSAACQDCSCTTCAAVTNDCFDSGDAARDADCAEIVRCGIDNDCLGSQCYCGLDVDPDAACIVSDGPCADLLDRAAGTPGALSVYGQQSDPNTAIGRASAVSRCHQAAGCDLVCP
jgi:hypothetical protein